MQSGAICLVALAGCGRLGFGTPAEGDGSVRADDLVFLDAMEVAVSDAPAVCVSWTARHFEPCALPSPLGPLNLNLAGEYTYDTTTGQLEDPNGATSTPASLLTIPGRVVSVDSFTVASTAKLRVVGNRPLIVASWSTIAVAGTIDVASGVSGPGAGANPPSCATHAAGAGRDDNSGGSGGGGGGFRGAGGGGGRGENINGGAGGPGVAPPLLEGGCLGARGGRSGSTNTGTPGDGGGAVQLTARDGLQISGVIHAGGSGGNGGSDDGGGGGGGSGGMIGLEAPMIMVTGAAILAANGGGGGGGADASMSGGRGADGAASTARAQGGVGGDNGDGAPGGNASGGLTLAGSPGGNSLAHAGGGGGGGAGYIVLASADVTVQSTTISPAYIAP